MNFLRYIMPIPLTLILSSNKKGDLPIQILEKEIIVAREYCSNPNNFSLCYFVYDSPIRTSPYMLNFNSKNIITGYNDTLYILMPKFYEKNIGLSIQTSPEKLDSILNSKIKNQKDLFKFKVSAKYKKVIKNELSQLKSKLSFDGYFYYAIFKLKIQYIKDKNKSVTLPNFDLKTGKGLIKIEERNINLITNISNVELLSLVK